MILLLNPPFVEPILPFILQLQTLLQTLEL